MELYCNSCHTNEGFKCLKLSSVNPDCFKYIIKGRSSAVKERIFSSICKILDSSATDYTLTLNYDGSVSGIYCEKKNFIVCDGTYPFDESSKTYGVADSEIGFNMFQSKKLLTENSDDILTLEKERLSQLKRCDRFLSAAAGLAKERKHLEKGIIDSRKISQYARRLWTRYGSYPNGRVGTEKRIFISVPTANGMKCYGEEMMSLCDTAIVIADTVGNVSGMIVDKVRRYALSSGTDVISGISYLDAQDAVEHIIVPSMHFGVFTDKEELTVKAPAIKRVRSSRFFTGKPDENIKVRLQFNQKADTALMKEVFASLKKAEEYSRKIDDYFDAATDTQRLVSYILNEVI